MSIDPRKIILGRKQEKRKLKRTSSKAEEPLKISKTTQSKDFCHIGLIDKNLVITYGRTN